MGYVLGSLDGVPPPGYAPGRKHYPVVSLKPGEVEGAPDDGFLSPPVIRRLPAGTMTSSDVLYGLSSSWHVEQLPPKRSRATVALTGWIKEIPHFRQRVNPDPLSTSIRGPRLNTLSGAQPAFCVVVVSELRQVPDSEQH